MSLRSQKSAKGTLAKQKRRYAEVRKEMLAMNNDPSRDVLQRLLEDHEGFDDIGALRQAPEP